MKQTKQAHKSGLGYGAVTMALISLVFYLGAASFTEAKSEDKHPEFNFPAFEVEAYGLDIATPEPIKIVTPWVGKRLRGTEITMTFHISKSGYVTLIEDDASRYDNDEFELACILHRKLRQWRFEPARDRNGNAITVKVEMPVKVVPKGSVPASEVACIALKHPVIVAIAQK